MTSRQKTTSVATAGLLISMAGVGIGWATILAIAFCGIDFAGIARLFTPEQGRDEHQRQPGEQPMRHRLGDRNRLALTSGQRRHRLAD